jgi:hypothetical protein
MLKVFPEVETMPNLSASDYTKFLKFKAAASSPIRPAIQTRDNVTLSQSVINANVLASQAAFVTTPNVTTVETLPAVVTAVSTSTVTNARTDILDGAVGDGTLITYTSSQAHGLATGDVVTITGFGGFAAANVTAQAIVVTDATTFTVAVAATGTATGNGSITGRVYYTTSVAHGLVAGDTVSITGITTFTASEATVLAAPTSTTFALSTSTTGTQVTGQTGSITGLVYFTTDAAHGLGPSSSNITVTGIAGTTAFNLSLFTVSRVPSSTVFSVASSVTGTAVTDETGTLTVTYYGNPRTSIFGISRVMPYLPGTTNNPKALSTITHSAGSVVAQPGGLPAKNRVGTYTRLPQIV